MDELLDFVDPEREVYISDVYGRACSLPATQHLIRSLSRNALSYLDLQISLPSLQSHIPPDSRLSVFSPVAD